MATAPPSAFPAPVIGRAAVSRQVVLVDAATQLEVTLLGNASNGHLFEITRVIRASIFGHVHHGVRVVAHESVANAYRRVEPLEQVAIKVYNRAKLREMAHTTHENPLLEIACLQFLGQGGGHPNVVRQLECSMDDENVFSVLEFVDGGELYDLIEHYQQLTPPVTLNEPTARSYFGQIVRGLQHCHQFGIGHRDLSLENILLDPSSGVCKIIDMGMCLKMAAAPVVDSTGEHQQLVYLPIPARGTCGKRNYIAPEIIENSRPFSPCKADAWALGVILFILLAGTPPIDYASSLDQRFRMVADGHLRVLLSTWQVNHISSKAVDLMEALLRVEPDDRLTVEEILEHPWLQEA
jgi:serine/threonine protein kinase